MSKVLLINPSLAFGVYAKSRIRATIPILPSLSLAMLAGSLRLHNYSVSIIDLAMENDPLAALGNKIDEYLPDFVGITSTTPLFPEVIQISKLIIKKRKDTNRDIKIIIGGPHPTALPGESLRESGADIVVMGEGERTILEIVESKDLSNIQGISYRKEGGYKLNPPRHFIEDLDALPLPALDLFEIEKYKCSKIITRRTPVAPIEMSRGCPFRCCFCNKNIFGRRFKMKSPDRIVKEIKHILSMGFKEIHVLDDQFTSNIERAKEVCEAILKENLDFTWNLRTGVRVDRIDQEFLNLAKRAGCYQLGIGFESGSQELLDRIGKDITLGRSRDVARMIKKSGIECAGYFMFGLPGETEETMQKTIDFAIELDIDYAKTTVLVPFPSTPIYDEYKAKGLIESEDWSKYNFHLVNKVYRHPNLSWDTMKRYYELFYRKFYIRPKYIWNRIVKGVFTGRLFYDAYYGVRTFFGG